MRAADARDNAVADRRCVAYTRRMVATAEELLEGALRLDTAERAALARAIIASLDDPTPDDTDALTAEVVRRARAVQDGTAVLVDGPTSLQAIRDRLGLR